MRVTVVILSGLVLGAAASASAQTKFTGKMQCAKPEAMHVMPVGDRPDHAMMLAKVKCTWTSGEIAGVQMKEEEDTIASDMRGTTARDRGYGVSTLASGDKVAVRFEGSTTFKDKTPLTGEGTWTFLSGTGKMKGIKGKGTFKGKYNPDGTVAWEIEGEFQISGTTPPH